MLGGFAFARHGTSLWTAFREVEFLAEIFLRGAVLMGSTTALTKTCGPEKDVFETCFSSLFDGVERIKEHFAQQPNAALASVELQQG